MIIFEDIMTMLLESGWTSYKLRKEKIFSESTLTRIRNQEPITTTTIEKICDLCDCQPGDLMHYTRTEHDE